MAFIAALQHLPARQRAVLILREVLRWKASEVAELLDTSVVSVNSALQRARSTLAESNVAESEVLMPQDEEQRALLARYVDAFERFDIDSLVSLLHEDATMSMPPYELWLEGADELRKWLLGAGSGCRGSRFEPVEANGSPAFAQWRAGGPGGSFEAWAIHVLRVSDGRIGGIGLTAYIIGIAVEIAFMSTTLYTGPAASAMNGTDLAWIVGLVITVPLYYLLAVRQGMRRPAAAPEPARN